MVITDTEFLLVNPDKTRLGWGVVHFIAFLQVDRVGEEGGGGGRRGGGISTDRVGEEGGGGEGEWEGEGRRGEGGYFYR